MPAPHKFTRSQLEQYYRRICLPGSRRIYDVCSLSPEEQISYLSLLTKHQLLNVPFENLTLHYSWHRVIDVDPGHVFDKVINQPGRGGYCMENNSLFHVVLSSLGFDVYMVPARVRDSQTGEFDGLTHCLNIVTIGGARYTVDVGFGPNGTSRPCLFEADLVQDHILPGQMRLRHGLLPGTSERAGHVWFYEHRTAGDAEWVPMYCFVDVEILPVDVRAMNWSPWLCTRTIFRKTIMCVLFTSADQVDENGKLRGKTCSGPVPAADGEDRLNQTDEAGELDGVVIIIGNNMKWRRKGEKKMEKVFKDEGERLEALEQYFGIVLSQRDRDAILGTATEISRTQS
jgi:arylamine N-acetyltransferase